MVTIAAQSSAERLRQFRPQEFAIRIMKTFLVQLGFEELLDPIRFGHSIARCLVGSDTDQQSST